LITSPPDDPVDDPPAPSSAPLAPFVRPAGCNEETSLDLLVYYEVNAKNLYDSLAKHHAPCSRYWVAIPKVAASAGNPEENLLARTLPKTNVHDLGDAFRATAEVHWGMTRDAQGNKHAGWKNVEVVKTGPATYETHEIPRAKYFRVSWYAKGVLFR